MDANRMIELAGALREAKSRQHVADAMRCQHPQIELRTPAFGTVVKGHAENAAVLTRFFTWFPDYHVTLEGHASGGVELVCWGAVRMTWTGKMFGLEPNGKQAVMPAFFRFGFRDDLISSELMHFDLAELCAQSGVSTDALRERLFGARKHPARQGT